MDKTTSDALINVYMQATIEPFIEPYILELSL